MKKKLYTLLTAILLITGMAYSQDILLESFDDPASIGNWHNSTAGDHTLTAASEFKEGTGAISLNYNLVADQGWGGSVDMQMNAAGGTYPDLNGTDGISFWYKVVAPASVTSNVVWNTKLYVNSTGGEEEWHAALGNVLGDMSGDWVQAKIAFSAFAIPSWLTTHDGVLYLDQITKIEMQIVAAEGITTTGEILIDGLTSYKEGGSNIGPLLESFDVVGDIGNWINSTDGSHSLNSSSDAVEGSASACLDYILIADQSWGGSVDMQFTPDGDLFPDLSADAGIRFNYKVLTPASVTNGVSLNFKLFIHSTGGDEEWHAALTNVLGDSSGEWQEGKIPFTNFSIPSWLSTFDGVLHLDQIYQIEMQVVTSTMGLETNGNICFDNLTSYSTAGITIFEGYGLNDFENPSSTVGSWINSTDGSYTLYGTDGSTQGDSAACVNYNLVADQGWGGSVDMQFLPLNGDTVFVDMTGHLGLSFWYKVNTPADIPGNVSFVVKTFVNSTGGTEEWHRTVGGVLANPSGEWIRVLIPFEAFSIPNWLTTYDGILYQDKIKEIQFQILGTDGTTTTGDICFDNLQSYDDEEVEPLSTVTPMSASVTIYPNPASDELTIAGLDKIEAIHVFNMNGSLVKTVKDRSTVNVSDLFNGLYILKIHTSAAVYSAKVMKQ